ncbi:MAG: Rrf2 family transcriptional regulator, partial [Candidatus Omnitrophica bacterium]|nr:Rrf2 family transcriptional regulator [Candidatus Omnitrophota bacterium]
ARELKIPRAFLRKILQVLHKNKFLEAFKGKKGGFLLNKPKDKIHLLELINAFQGPFRLSECLFKRMPCPNIHKCSLRKKIKEIERYIVEELKHITIASLIKR